MVRAPRWFAGRTPGVAAPVLAIVVVGGWALTSAFVAAPQPGTAPPSSSPDASCESGPWRELILDHARRYPSMELADAYKLLHQATLGSEHMVSHVDAARGWLMRELAEMGDGPEEPLVGALGDPATVARVHLRPFVAADGDPERLLAAFVETARGSYADPAALDCALGSLVSLAATNRVPWDKERTAAYLAERAAAGHDAVHHSPEFEAAYRPAYRIVAVELLDRVFGN